MRGSRRDKHDKHDDYDEDDERDESDDCDECACEGTGHLPGCDSLEPAWDIGDLLFRSGCRGCCPNCRPHGFQAIQDEMSNRVHKFFDKFNTEDSG